MLRYMTQLKVGDMAPSFSLPDGKGMIRSLSAYVGEWILLYFYPKDDTPGCTKEACAIRDALPDFGKLGVTVLGVSVDSPKSHEKFAEKYQLPFTLLSDEKKEAVGKYGVWAEKKFMGRQYMGTLRTSFLIDPEGKIAKIYEDVEPVGHAAHVLADLSSLIQ